MFEYVRAAVAARFDHPVLATTFLVAACLAAGGIVVETAIRVGMSDWRIGAGFLGVFAVFFALIGLIGYGALFLAKLLSIARDRVGPASG